MAYLEVKDINKSFGHVQALEGASVASYEGEVLAIVGDNGAGKSTLIKIISGVITPDSGVIKIGDREFSSLTVSRAIEAGVSTVYQDLALGNTMDAASNIFLGREISAMGFLRKNEMRRRSEELLRSLDIRIPDVTEPVGNLSGGQRQGVAVARLINQGGRIFIFDEPTAAMGISETNAVLRLIRRLADDGYTVIMISHNLPQVFSIADRICVMRHGHVIAEKKTEETSMDEVVSLITGAINVQE